MRSAFLLSSGLALLLAGCTRTVSPAEPATGALTLRELTELQLVWDPSLEPGVVAALVAPDADLRQTAAQVLVRHGGEATVEALIETLEERPEAPSPEALLVIGELASHSPPVAVEFLVGLAEDLAQPEAVRLTAVQALGRTGEPQAVPCLVELRQGDAGAISEMAGGSLARLTFHSDVEDWASWWLAHGDADRRGWAQRRLSPEHLRTLGSAPAVAARLAGHPSRGSLARLEEDLLASMAFLGDPDGGLALAGAASLDGAIEVQLGALLLVPRALQLACGEESLTGLVVQGIEASEPRLRKAALQIAVRLRRPEPMPACIEALGDEDEEVRYLAVTALRTYSGEQFQFDHTAPPGHARREVAQETWRVWWRNHQATLHGPSR